MSNTVKAAKQKVLSGEIVKMLKHFEKFSFLNFNKNQFNLGYNGESLKQNILNEWLLSNSVTCDEPSFLGPSSISKLDFWKTLGEVWSKIDLLPCGVVLKDQFDTLERSSSHSQKDDCNGVNTMNTYFQEVSGLKLQKYLFYKPQAYEDLFVKLQRERQIWWKKFSVSPGRFTTSEIFHDNRTQSIDILAEFPWGNIPVEKIKLLEIPEDKLSFFKVKPKEKILPTIVKSEMMLERTVLTFLCDSFEVMNDKCGTIMLRFHRKLAPFKVSFSAIASTPGDEKNLKDLALLLTKQIRKFSISVLLLPDICSTPLDEQICRNDALGIPYTIIMDSKTLTNGLLGIRSRDTTLQEQSHVGSVIPYVEKLMKNY